MPIAAIFNFPGESIDKYEKVFEHGGSAIHDQPKRLAHVCYQTDDGFTVVDVWADEDAFGAFGEVIGPAIAQAGLEGRPDVRLVQGFMLADGIRNP